jgi:aerobic-type carbon monoxide dehydrogenase small subunit (CoxS/CutS family)
MDKSKKKKHKTYTRRAFLEGMGGGALGVTVVSRLLGKDSAQAKSEQGELATLAKKRITFIVNGKSVTLDVEPRETLLDVLRNELNLTGAKKTCDRAECGGCTVLLDDKPIYSCQDLAIRANGKRITTVEGLAEGKSLHPVQQAFINKDGYQCGFCTTGFIMASVALLNHNKTPSQEDIKSALSGNLCRCGNYAKMTQAVQDAAGTMRKV